MLIATRERESLDLSFTTDPITTIVYKIDGYRIEKQAELNGGALLNIIYHSLRCVPHIKYCVMHSEVS